ncbi:hypothetical protein ACFX2J_023653 [Malus domestica]
MNPELGDGDSFLNLAARFPGVHEAFELHHFEDLLQRILISISTSGLSSKWVLVVVQYVLRGRPHRYDANAEPGSALRSTCGIDWGKREGAMASDSGMSGSTPCLTYSCNQPPQLISSSASFV